MTGSETSMAEAQTGTFTGLKRFLDGWLLELANLLWHVFAVGRQQHATIHKSLDGLVVSTKRGRQIGKVPIDDDSPCHFENVGTILRKSWVSRAGIVLQLAGDQVLVKQLTYPTAVRDVLEPVVRNQLQSLVPWPAEETCFEYRITDRSGEKISVLLVAIHQNQIDAMQKQAAFARIGLTRIEATSTDDKSKPIILYDEATRKRKTLANAIGRMLGLLAVAAILSGAIGCYQWVTAARANDKLVETIANVRGALTKFSEQSSNETKVGDQANELSGLKSRTSLSVSLLDALSSAIPDQAYLTNLTIRRASLIISGRADDAAELIASLERSGQLQTVKFGGPTIREADGEKESFTIEAKISNVVTSGGLTERRRNDR